MIQFALERRQTFECLHVDLPTASIFAPPISARAQHGVNSSPQTCSTAAAVVVFLGAWGLKSGGAVLRELRGTFNSRWEVRLVGFWVTESAKVASPSLASARRLRATSEIETVLQPSGESE